MSQRIENVPRYLYRWHHLDDAFLQEFDGQLVEIVEESSLYGNLSRVHFIDTDQSWWVRKEALLRSGQTP